MSNNKPLTKPCYETIEGNEWILFPNTVPPPLKHPKDCIDAVKSVCTDVDLDDCIKECKHSNRCDFGYHIKTPDRNYCISLYTSDYYPDANPVYYLKNKDDFKETNFKNITTASFMDTRTWGERGILPDEANAVFYGDVVSLKNKKDKKIFGLTRDKKSPIFKESTGYSGYLKLNNIYSSELVDKIQYGDSISFQVKQKTDKGFKNTSEVLTETITNRQDDSVSFQDINQAVQTNNEKFTIISPRKVKHNQTVNYGDNFLLRTSVGYLENKLVGKEYKLVVNNNYDPNKDGMKDSFLFTFYNVDKPLYYCQNGKCMKDRLGNAQTVGSSAKYNDTVAYTRSDCFGSCGWKDIGECKNEFKPSVSIPPSTKKPLSSLCIVLIIATILLILIAVGVMFM